MLEVVRKDLVSEERRAESRLTLSHWVDNGVIHRHQKLGKNVGSGKEAKMGKAVK